MVQCTSFYWRSLCFPRGLETKYEPDLWYKSVLDVGQWQRSVNASSSRQPIRAEQRFIRNHSWSLSLCPQSRCRLPWFLAGLRLIPQHSIHGQIVPALNLYLQLNISTYSRMWLYVVGQLKSTFRNYWLSCVISEHILRILATAESLEIENLG